MAFGSRGHADHDSLGQCAGPKLGLTGGYNLSWTKVNSEAFSNLVSGGSGAGWFIGPKVDLDLILGLHLDGAFGVQSA